MKSIKKQKGKIFEVSFQEEMRAIMQKFEKLFGKLEQSHVMLYSGDPENVAWPFVIDAEALVGIEKFVGAGKEEKQLIKLLDEHVTNWRKATYIRFENASNPVIARLLTAKA